MITRRLGELGSGASKADSITRNCSPSCRRSSCACTDASSWRLLKSWKLVNRCSYSRLSASSCSVTAGVALISAGDLVREILDALDLLLRLPLAQRGPLQAGLRLLLHQRAARRIHAALLELGHRDFEPLQLGLRLDDVGVLLGEAAGAQVREEELQQLETAARAGVVVGRRERGRLGDLAAEEGLVAARLGQLALRDRAVAEQALQAALIRRRDPREASPDSRSSPSRSGLRSPGSARRDARALPG